MSYFDIKQTIFVIFINIQCYNQQNFGNRANMFYKNIKLDKYILI